MEYNWDKEKLKTLKKEYLNLKRHTSGLTKEDKKFIQTKLNYIQEMEEILSPSKFNFSFSHNPKYADQTEFLPKSTLKEYQKIPSFIRKWILNAMQVLSQYENIPSKQTLPNFKLTDKELVELSNDFFRWLPHKSYAQIASKYMDKNEKLLRIQKNTYKDYYGQTFPFSYPLYTPYFLIDRQNTINDFCSLNHEIAHGIFYGSDTNISTTNNHQYLLELEGYFFDYLSLEFLKEKKIVSSEIAQKLFCNEFIDLQDEILLTFYFQYLSIALYQKQNKIEIEEVNRKLLEQHMPYEINEGSLLVYLRKDSIELARYALCALTSMDLEKMFTQDRELAFSNFEKIRYNKTNDIEKNLREHGITFMDDKYNNLQEKMQKLSLIKK